MLTSYQDDVPGAYALGHCGKDIYRSPNIHAFPCISQTLCSSTLWLFLTNGLQDLVTLGPNQRERETLDLSPPPLR